MSNVLIHFARLGVLAAVAAVPLTRARAAELTVPADMPVTAKELSAEIETKLARVNAFLDQQGLAGILLTRVDNFSWATAGLADNHIVITSESGAASLLLMRDGHRYVIGEHGEISRLTREGLPGLGYEPRDYLWYEDKGNPDRKLRIIHDLAGQHLLGTDTPYADLQLVAEKFAPVRYQLTESEVAKYRWAGHAASEAVSAVCRKLHPGMSEREIEAMASDELMKRGLRPTVLLMGVDHRVFDYYHHTPSDLKLKQYAIVNVCARRWGLVVSVARFVHFGPADADLRKKESAAMKISAEYQAHSHPGITAGEMLEMAKTWFAAEGFAGDWQEHHQGGAIGYAEREWLAYPGSKDLVHDHQAFAWNPIIHGALSFDTIIVYNDRVENLTRIADWPATPVVIEGKTYLMPRILVRQAQSAAHD